MLLGDLYLLDTHVILKDVDGSTIELTAHDAWKFHCWILANKVLLFEAMRRADFLARRVFARQEENNEKHSTE